LIGGDFVKGQEYLFIYNGTFFDTTIMNVPIAPSQLTFYVRSDSTSIVDMNPASSTAGLESNSGLANTPQDAFKTIQGAMNTIASRYISTQTITIRVSDGTYTTGGHYNSQYVAKWDIIGNTANPGNVTIDCRNLNVSSYVPGIIWAGICFMTGTHGRMEVNGFNCQSYWENIACEGNMILRNIHFNGPVSGQTPFQLGGGQCFVWDTHYYSTTVVCGWWFWVSNGFLAIGDDGSIDATKTTLSPIGTPTLSSGVVGCTSAGTCTVYNGPGNYSWTAACVAPQFTVDNAGGIGFQNGDYTTGTQNALPGNSDGIVGSGGYIY
jgi:hypothetical protein